MSATKKITEILKQSKIHPVIVFPENAVISKLDLSKSNSAFTPAIYNDFGLFTQFIKQQHADTNAAFLIGGYREERDMYRRSELFGVLEEPRSLHLGMDIWGEAGTPVHAPLNGKVHSFRFNDNFGDYGATIILEHQVADLVFFILYGHLALRDLDGLYTGKVIAQGEVFAHFGIPIENGHWPPHLHFQVIMDMGGLVGDYPGVCKPSEALQFLDNSPDPAMLLPF